jgi:hypothetical protein
MLRLLKCAPSNEPPKFIWLLQALDLPIAFSLTLGQAGGVSAGRDLIRILPPLPNRRWLFMDRANEDQETR